MCVQSDQLRFYGASKKWQQKLEESICKQVHGNKGCLNNEKEKFYL